MLESTNQGIKGYFRTRPSAALLALGFALSLALPAGAATSGSGSGSVRQHRNGPVLGSSSHDVTLDFVAADINDVLKALAVQTGSNIVSSTDVKGTITVSLAHVSLEQALDIITRLSGFQYAMVGNTYVVGTPASISAMASPTSATASAPVTAVVPFTYANPDDLLTILSKRFPEIKVTNGTSVSGKQAGAGSKAIVVSGDSNLVSQAKDLIVQIDTTLGQNANQETTVAYKVKYSAIGDLINVLATLVPNLIVTPGPGQGFNAKAPSASSSILSSGSTGFSGASGASGGGSAGPTGSSQSNLLGPTMLLLTGAPDDIAHAQQLLATIDIQPAEILYDAKVTEITNNDQKNIGLNWDFTGANTQIGEVTPVTPAGTTLPSGTVLSQYPGNILKFGIIGRTPISDLATVSLDALINDNKAKLLADPNIAGLDGQAAQVFIGDTINYVQSITQSTTGENISTASVQVGVTLRVTGHLNSDGYITLNLHPEVSSITSYLQVPGGGELPDIQTRFADTTVRVKDGETIAIGGLIQDQDILGIQKVPFFGDLPFFGNFFKNTSHQKTRDEVVFFLKTSVLKNS